MRQFHCPCGQRVFFEDSSCLACGRELGFDRETLELHALGSEPSGQNRALCRNRIEYGNCNWMAEPGFPLCLSCGLNEVIPDLSRPGNLELWSHIERAKRRLVYTLLRLDLPLRGVEGGPPLSFRILEDRRRNPNVVDEFVFTGHADGVITVNLAEADAAERHSQRTLMRERYRTVLGHLRHEAGHYYFRQLTADPGRLAESRTVFGDDALDYEATLSAYYAGGARFDWAQYHVSAYASAHPMEDFAETFAHYLLIVDALETAGAAGLATSATGPDAWIYRWIELSVTLNALNRSLGQEDAYPFVLKTPVVEKLKLIDRFVRRRA